MKTEKEKLQEKLNQIEENERLALQEINYPEICKKYLGKCFKVRNNYSCPEKASDYWFLYLKVTEIKKEDVYQTSNGVSATYSGYSFQTDKYKNVNVRKENGYIHYLGEEITQNEFDEAWNKMINRVNSIKG